MSEARANGKVRESIVAGIFYAEDPSELASAVDRALGGAPAGRTDALAILSPHAGFDYSGSVQAAAWKAASGRKLERVVILAPRHRSQESAVYLPESAQFQTPLGNLAVDRAFCEELESCGTIFETNDIPHLEEHAIELQLPFMKRLFPEARLVPIVLAGRESAAISSVAKALDLVLAGDFGATLVVASSNLASSIVAADAARRSDELLALVSAGDWRAVALSRESEDQSACGAAVIATVMAMNSLRGTTYEPLLRVDSLRRRENSAERVVHYGAAAWFPRPVSERP